MRNLLFLAVLGTLVLPAPAQADPVSDCADNGKLDRRYSNKELRRALNHIPSELAEYSDCRQVIEGAITSGSDKGENRPGSGSGANAGSAGNGELDPSGQGAPANDAAELEAITSDANGSGPRVTVDGEEVQPGPDGLFDIAGASNDVPVPLLVALIALGLLAILGGLMALRERVPALGRIPLLSKIPRVSLPRFRR